jgi:hypothetical protein
MKTNLHLGPQTSICLALFLPLGGRGREGVVP